MPDAQANKFLILLAKQIAKLSMDSQLPAFKNNQYEG